MVVEPSEILTEGKPPRTAAVHPLFRLVARAIDYGLFFLLLQFFAAPSLFSSILMIPLHFALWIPVEAVLMALWGLTPGKWLMRIEVKKGHAKRLPFECALKRSFLVWFRGLGAGVPIINFFCGFYAYQRLISLRCSSWDRELGIVVIHHYLPRWRLWCSVSLAALLWLIHLTHHSISFIGDRVG